MAAKIYTGSSVSNELLQNTILVSQALGQGLKKFASDPAVIKANPIENGYYCRLNAKGLSTDKTIRLHRPGKGVTDLPLKQGQSLGLQLGTALGGGKAAKPRSDTPNP